MSGRNDVHGTTMHFFFLLNRATDESTLVTFQHSYSALEAVKLSGRQVSMKYKWLLQGKGHRCRGELCVIVQVKKVVKIQCKISIKLVLMCEEVRRQKQGSSEV